MFKIQSPLPAFPALILMVVFLLDDIDGVVLTTDSNDDMMPILW